jgi:hypothetical protein
MLSTAKIMLLRWQINVYEALVEWQRLCETEKYSQKIMSHCYVLHQSPKGTGLGSNPGLAVKERRRTTSLARLAAWLLKHWLAMSQQKIYKHKSFQIHFSWVQYASSFFRSVIPPLTYSLFIFQSIQNQWVTKSKTICILPLVYL